MAAHRNRQRVRVRSFVDSHILRFCSEREARILCGETNDGHSLIGDDGKVVQPVAIRLSRLKAPLTDIKLLAPQRRDRQSPSSIIVSESENNAFVHEGVRLSPNDAIRPLDRAVEKIDAWPTVYDEKAPVICAGKAYGASAYPEVPNYIVSFA